MTGQAGRKGLGHAFTKKMSVNSDTRPGPIREEESGNDQKLGENVWNP